MEKVKWTWKQWTIVILIIFMIVTGIMGTLAPAFL